MTDAQIAEWRATGFEAGVVYANELALLMQDPNADEAGIQTLVAGLGERLQEEAKRLREERIPEDLIAEYTRAAVEAVMVRMHAIRTSTGAGEARP